MVASHVGFIQFNFTPLYVRGWLNILSNNDYNLCELKLFPMYLNTIVFLSVILNDV